jgi:hypothetical protein
VGLGRSSCWDPGGAIAGRGRAPAAAVPRCGVWPESGPPPTRGGEVKPLGRADGADDAAAERGVAGADVAGRTAGLAEAAGAGDAAGAETASVGAGAVGGEVGALTTPGAEAPAVAVVGTVAVGADEAGAGAGGELGRAGAVAVELMAVVSEGLGRGEGIAAAGAAGAAVGFFINCLIRSTIAGSRLASALTLTSSPQRWMRSSSSWLFRPNSFANSWTRVDNGNSSWMGLRPGLPARSGLVNPSRPVESRPVCRSHQAVTPPGAGTGGSNSGGWIGGVVDAVGPPC